MHLLGALVCTGLVLAACSASEGGPDSPRPVPSMVSTTTTSAPKPTTTAVTVTLEASPYTCEAAFCLVYHISSDASWSTGDPVTAADFAHTLEVHKDPDLVEAASGYSLIEGFDIIDTKTFLTSFSSPYGAWQSLFDRVYPAGASRGDIAEFPTSGPFNFLEWTEGETLTIERASDRWAATDPISRVNAGDVQRVTFVFIESVDEMVDALGDGEVDVITARPDVAAVESLATMENVTFTLAPGPFWEHIDFHHEDPLLSQLWVREAISTAIDREKILDRTIRLIDPAADSLDNTVFMTNTANYEEHFRDNHDPERAEGILVDHACARDQNGVHVCDGNRMSFTWASTDDDPARAEILASVREDLSAVGIELRAVLRSPSEFVTRDFLFGDPDVWQLINFSWRARPDPAAANSTYYCDSAGDLNVNRYCSEEVADLIRGTERIIEPSARVDAYNQADRLYLDDLAVIPLYQKPILMAWNTEVSGPEPNFTVSADLWNLASWTGKESITVGLPTEPADLDPLSRGDESANVILGALLYGAFGMNPSHEFIPVLVDSVEIVEGQG